MLSHSINTNSERNTATRALHGTCLPYPSLHLPPLLHPPLSPALPSYRPPPNLLPPPPPAGTSYPPSPCPSWCRCLTLPLSPAVLHWWSHTGHSSLSTRTTQRPTQQSEQCPLVCIRVCTGAVAATCCRSDCQRCRHLGNKVCITNSAFGLLVASNIVQQWLYCLEGPITP